MPAASIGAEHRRRLAHDDRAGAEAVDDEAEFGELPGALGEPVDVLGRQVDDLRDEQDLAGDAVLGERPLHALIDQPLMRRVLVDDDQPVLGLGDDVGLVDLRPRRAERARERGRVRLRRACASAEGCTTAKAACAASAKPVRQRRIAARPAGATTASPAAAGARSRRPGGRRRSWRRPPSLDERSSLRAQRLAQRADDQAADQAGIAEAHLRLGRVDVDVDQRRIEREEQHRDRMAVALHDVGIGGAERAEELRSRTGRPLTKRYCASPLPRL